MTIWDDLASEFPREVVSWRAQTLTQDGSKALALCYIDARDVMKRLDEMVGPQHWQDRYEVHGSKTICYISIEVEQGVWITKADGAGDSDIEAEKGSLSDAFKRCAVKWGVGRYLYDIPSPWVPCEHNERGGKKYWSRWKDDPWNHVRGKPAPSPAPSKPVAQPTTADLESRYEKLKTEMLAESAGGYQKLVTWVNDASVLQDIQNLGRYEADFKKEFKDVAALAKEAESTFGAVGQIVSRTMPNFDTLDTSPTPDPIDELIGINHMESERE